MANVFDGKKWYLDTVSAGTAITTDQVVVSKIRWVSANAAGHLARLSDGNGQPANGFWTSVAGGMANVEESNLFRDMSRDKRTLNGLRVMTLTSGWLEVWTE